MATKDAIFQKSAFLPEALKLPAVISDSAPLLDCLARGNPVAGIGIQTRQRGNKHFLREKRYRVIAVAFHL